MDIDDEKLETLDRAPTTLDCILGVVGVILMTFLVLSNMGLIPADWFSVEYTNVTEVIVDKQITFIDQMFQHENHYFIFTEDYCFDIDLSDYNKLNVGDKVNLNVSEYGSAELRMDNYTVYHNC